MDIWNVLTILFAIWFGFQWGKHYARNKEKRAERVFKQASQESDPATKTRLLIEWYKLTEESGLKKTLKRNLGWGKKKARGR